MKIPRITAPPPPPEPPAVLELMAPFPPAPPPAPPMAPTMTPPAPPGSSGSPSRNGLLEQIQERKKLKETPVPTKTSTTPSSSPKTVMGVTLNSAAQKRVNAIQRATEKEENDSNTDPNNWDGGRRKTRKNRKRRKTRKRRKNNKRRTKKNLKYIKR